MQKLLTFFQQFAKIQDRNFNNFNITLANNFVKFWTMLELMKKKKMKSS